jgi:hypothetical protein
MSIIMSYTDTVKVPATKCAMTVPTRMGKTLLACPVISSRMMQGDTVWVQAASMAAEPMTAYTPGSKPPVPTTCCSRDA